MLATATVLFVRIYIKFRALVCGCSVVQENGLHLVAFVTCDAHFAERVVGGRVGVLPDK